MDKMKQKKLEMVEYLKNHFRYWTMNSWNKSTSYAQNVKIYNFVPKKLLDSAYALIEEGSIYHIIDNIIEAFNRRWDYNYRIWFNGRSGGYMVLGRGGKREMDYKSQCDICSRFTWYNPGSTCQVDGCKGILKKIEKPIYRVYTQPGEGIDEDIDWDSEDIDNEIYLEERYKLVKDFDRTVEKCKREFIRYCKEYKVIEKEIMVPKTIKILERKV